MSSSEFRNRRAVVETHFGTHPAFNALIPLVDQMYRCVRTVAQKNFPADMGKLLMLCNREFLVGTSLLQSGLPFDAAANTRRAIEIAKLALAIKRDRGNAAKWMRATERQERWDDRMAGKKPKQAPQFQVPDVEADPLFAPLKVYFGMYSDTFVHFTPEFVGQQHFEETPGEDGVKIIHLPYFASDRIVVEHAITICGLHGKILLLFDACFDNLVSNDKGWQILKATFDQLGIDLRKNMPPDEDSVPS